MYTTDFSQRCKSNSMEGRQPSQQMALEQLDSPKGQKINFDLNLTPYKNINSKWSKHLIINIKLLGKKHKRKILGT